MQSFSEQLTHEALAHLQGSRDARFKAVMTSLITHLHALVREMELPSCRQF
ncbi:hypothetical protein [Undibacterium sp.]|jgi:hypothetical protein|uniref:hypothetical protein n=1 Tax=Undibacterium sp. TaxID=1914977 RepID=UPI002CA7F376|nr:hypothetical protein [Undibacterium sp.]HTD02200.1 hypothetical protein [Undibacterium sp.]